ncbi:hypothetical protein HZA96_02895 [Candidatus Woesearchaeota archaeon]|nr:hypothetical protein [Candidatus Woesearchaeota archaeon]
MYKKSQITFFIIIGIVIIGGIFLGYNLMHSTSEKKSEVQQEKQIDIQAKIKKYNKYIDSCLEQTTTEGLVVLGKQGGAIFQVQDGDEIPGALPIGDPELKYLEYNDKTGKKTKVVYGITAPRFFGNHPDVPQYPYGIVKLVKDPKAVYNIQNPFGNYPGFFPLVALCDADGQNKALSCGAHPKSYDLKNKKDETEKININTFSIQDLLEKYVNEKIKKCIKLENFPELKELVDQGKAVIGNANTTIIIKEEGVEATLTLSGKIINGDKQSDIAFIKNKVLVSIHIKQIHALVSYLIKNDINNIFFDITQDASNEDMQLCDAINDKGQLIKYQCLKQKMKIYKQNDVGVSNNLNQLDKEPIYDDLLVVEDSSKLIDNEPYKFQVAIQNRIPAIDLIKDLSEAESKVEQYQLADLGKYVDFVIQTGSAKQINEIGIKAYDPDEDFHIAGEMNEASYKMFTATDAAGCGVDASYLTQNFYLLITQLESCEFPATDKEIIEIKFDSEGYYPVKVIVCDNANKCDYQLVRVLVLPSPE